MIIINSVVLYSHVTKSEKLNSKEICIDRYKEMSKTENWNCTNGKYPVLFRGGNRSWILKLQSRKCRNQKNKWPTQFESAKSLPSEVPSPSLISVNTAPSS
jgi:hypothetical protein